jgi:hypothetical protein
VSIKVKAICNWTDSASLSKIIIQQSLYSESDGIEFVDDDSYEWLFIFNNKVGEEILVPKERVIGFIQEPPISSFFDKEIGKYCSVVYTCTEPHAYNIDGNIVGFPCGMLYQMEGNLTDYLDGLDKQNKRRVISMVTSNFSHGFYSFRHNMAKALATCGWVDVYGRDLDVPGCKGGLGNKADGLIPYKLSVCMENSIWDDYISDKIIDAVLCRTIPIYVGARNIHEHIPFAIRLESYRNASFAKAEIEHIVSSVNYDSLLPQMNDWVRKYANEYTIYSKIKQTIINS